MKRFFAVLFFLLAAAPRVHAAVTITAHSLLINGSTSTASSYVTASVSPVANEVTVVFVANSKAAAPASTPTLSGNGITWNSIGSRTFAGTGFRRVTAFWGVNASPSAGAITIDFASVNQTGCNWLVVGFPNADTTAPIVQGVSNAAFSSSLTLTLAGFSSTDNATFGMFAFNSVVNMTPGSGFTEINDTGVGSVELQSEFLAGQDTTVDSTGTGNHDFAGIAIELKPGASTPPPSPTTISVNPLDHGANGVNHTTDTTNSFTPVANEPILVAVTSSMGSAQILTPTISGCGITWNQERTRFFAGSPTTSEVTVWSGVTATPSSCALTITYGQNVLRADWKINGFTGADPNSPVVQSADNAGFAQALTVTLAAFGNVSNATYGVFRWNASTAATVGSGFTQITQDNTADTFMDEFKNTNDTTVDATFAGGVNKDVGGIACELRIGTAVTVSPLLTLLLEEQ